MIDEKKLTELHAAISCGASLDEEGDELIRLARLGLWAEKHGVPALNQIIHAPCCDCGAMLCCTAYPDWAKKALAALPKDMP